MKGTNISFSGIPGSSSPKIHRAATHGSELYYDAYTTPNFSSSASSPQQHISPASVRAISPHKKASMDQMLESMGLTDKYANEARMKCRDMGRETLDEEPPSVRSVPFVVEHRHHRPPLSPGPERPSPTRKLKPELWLDAGSVPVDKGASRAKAKPKDNGEGDINLASWLGMVLVEDRSDERMVQNMLEQEDLEKQMKRHPLSQLPGNIGSTSNAHTKSAAPNRCQITTQTGAMSRIRQEETLKWHAHAGSGATLPSVSSYSADQRIDSFALSQDTITSFENRDMLEQTYLSPSAEEAGVSVDMFADVLHDLHQGFSGPVLTTSGLAALGPSTAKDDQVPAGLLTVKDVVCRTCAAPSSPRTPSAAPSSSTAAPPRAPGSQRHWLANMDWSLPGSPGSLPVSGLLGDQSRDTAAQSETLRVVAEKSVLYSGERRGFNFS